VILVYTDVPLDVVGSDTAWYRTDFLTFELIAPR